MNSTYDQESVTSSNSGTASRSGGRNSAAGPWGRLSKASDAEKIWAVVLRVSNVAAWLVLSLFMLLASVHALGERSVADVTDSQPSLLSPGTGAFSIWGLISALWFAFVLYGVLPIDYGDLRINRQINVLWIANCVLLVVWLLLWTHEHLAATAVILWAALLVQLVIYLRINPPVLLNDIDDGLDALLSQPSREARLRRYYSRLLRWFAVNLPFSVSLAWLAVATTLNTFLSIKYDLDYRTGEAGWASVLLVFLALLSVVVGALYRDAAFAAVLCWATAFVAQRQANASHTVLAFAIIAAIVSGVTAVVCLVLAVVRFVAATRAIDKPRRAGART